MNTFAKGSLAAGAGLVLLLGGAGTLAYWNDTADLTGGTIDAGTLELSAPDGTWSQAGTPVPGIADRTMVPGDELTYTTDLALLAQGDTIEGTVVLDESFVTMTGDAGQIDVAVAVPDGAALPAGVTFADEIFTFTDPSGAAPYSIPVEVTVTFPYLENAEQNASQGAVVDMEQISFVATQTPADTAVSR